MFELRRLVSVAVVVAGIALVATDAQAYPQYIAKGYATCGSCHYSPSGGGMLNAYGVATMQAMLPDALDVSAVATLRDWMQKNYVTGRDDDGNAAFHWDVGMDSRMMFLQTATEQYEEEKELLFIPMLFEAQAVMAYGDLLSYGSVTVRRKGADRNEVVPYSRTHWLRYRFSDELSVRAGRMMAPFGVQMPDHTAYTRRDIGFDKYDQTYGVQLDWQTEDVAVAAMVFAGNYLIGSPQEQERGASVVAEYLLPGRAAIGISLLGGRSELVGRLAAAAFVRAKLWYKTYTVLEIDGQRRSSVEGTASEDAVTTLARLGWFPAEWLDIYFEFRSRHLADADDLGRMAYVFGASWQVLPWIEISPVFRMTEGGNNGSETYATAQLHVLY